MANRALGIIVGLLLCIAWSTDARTEKVPDTQTQSKMGITGKEVCQRSKENMPNAQRRDRAELERQLEQSRKAAEAARETVSDESRNTAHDEGGKTQRKKQQKFGSQPPTQGVPNDKD
jgi:hypothetical protein